MRRIRFRVGAFPFSLLSIEFLFSFTRSLTANIGHEQTPGPSTAKDELFVNVAEGDASKVSYKLQFNRSLGTFLVDTDVGEMLLIPQVSGSALAIARRV